MALVFQYGSNMSIARLNDERRLVGDAKLHGVVKTVSHFDFGFTVLSKTNNCAAADIVPSDNGRTIYGVLYDIPDWLVLRDDAIKHNRKSLDAIEGEGQNYIRQNIELVDENGLSLTAITYLVRERKSGLKTSLDYVEHIFCGLSQRGFPKEYRSYITSQVVKNIPEKRDDILTLASKFNISLS